MTKLETFDLKKAPLETSEPFPDGGLLIPGMRPVYGQIAVIRGARAFAWRELGEKVKRIGCRADSCPLPLRKVCFVRGYVT